MKKPLQGGPVGFRDYLAGSLGTHLTGVFGGVIWGAGMSLNLIASGRAGYAISYGLGQGATMIAALWGVFIWKEFRTAPAGTSTLLAAMFASFVCGLATHRARAPDVTVALESSSCISDEAPMRKFDGRALPSPRRLS